MSNPVNSAEEGAKENFPRATAAWAHVIANANMRAQLDIAEARATTAESEVARLTAEVARVEAERDEALAEIGRLSDPLLRDMRLENGEINMAVAGPVVERLALAMTGYFRESGAENYVEINLNARDNCDDRYCVTVQNVFKKSPHQLRLEAESSASALRERVAVLEKALERAADTLTACVGVLSAAGETTASMETAIEEAAARAALKESRDA